MIVTDNSKKTLVLCATDKRQTTLMVEFMFEGMGIFSGHTVKFVAKPAPPDTGIVFIKENIRIPAVIENVEEVPNRTRLSVNNTSIDVIEHLISALNGLGVNNAIIEVDSDELPILDASACDYVQEILKAGVVEQDSFVLDAVVNLPVFIEEENALLGLFPGEIPRITYILDHKHPMIGRQADSVILNRDNYCNLIGPARTFVTEDEARMLIESKVVGTDDRNLAIVVGSSGPNQVLRHPLEFVHHKMLDMIGDLALAHWPVRGHIIGIRSGHIINRKLARLIKENLV